MIHTQGYLNFIKGTLKMILGRREGREGRKEWGKEGEREEKI